MNDLVPIPIRPGLFTLDTDRGAEGRWKTGNRVRFFKGLPEPIGGWVRQTDDANMFVGVCRNLIDFITLDGMQIVGIGTHTRYYLWAQGTMKNITPYRLATSSFGGGESTLSNPFTTANASTTVQVTHTSHGAFVGDTVYFSGASSVAGITISGAYTIASIVSNNAYNIVHNVAANASTTGGGTVHYAYEINVGVTDQVGGLGWGAGYWGQSTWGSPRTTTIVTQLPRTWSHDTWGEDLIINPRSGGIYVWDASLGLNTRAAKITNAPAQSLFMMVSPIDRTLIAFGCTPLGGGANDPLLIRWSSQEDYTAWTPATTNTAGDKRLDGGNEIMSALRVGKEILIFTDRGVWGMYFIGGADVFGFQQLSDSHGLIGPNARVEYGGAAYWMGRDDFFMYDGAVRRMQCEVHNYVFDDINRTQGFKFHASRNERYGEITWFYCSRTSLEIDRYVTANVEEGTWYFGELQRTAWLPQSQVLEAPVATGLDGHLYAHETGIFGDGQPLNEHLETWDMEADRGGNALMIIDKLIPDFLTINGSVSVQLFAKKYPHGEQVSRGPWSVNSTTTFLKPRIRGRQIALKITGGSGFWRMGQWRAAVKPHGSR